MKPVRVRTVQVKSAPIKLASAVASQPSSRATGAAPSARSDEPETSGSVKAEMPPQPANHGTGHGLLGVLPASNVTTTNSQAGASADRAPQPIAIQNNGAIKPAPVHTGWIIQVGALESESQALQRIEAARDQASGMLGKADSLNVSVAAEVMLYETIPVVHSPALAGEG